MTTTMTTTTESDARRDRAAERVYTAECWLHTARQSGVDEWIAQAGDLLHRAIVEYRALAACPGAAA